MLSGRAHKIGSNTTIAAQDFNNVWSSKNLPKFGEQRDTPICFKLGGTKKVTRLLTFAMTNPAPETNPLLATLPAYLVCSAHNSQKLTSLATQALEFITIEQSDPQPGFSTIAKHLCSALFSQCLRQHLTTTESPSQQWLAGFKDPRIGKALAIMHSRPDEQWTVAQLADEIGMARSSFARVFKAMIGQSPMEYLIDCRLATAEKLLIEDSIHINQLARVIGYNSEQSFRKAFYKRFGVSPSDYQKTQRKI